MMNESKRVLFLCGSPRGAKSASRCTAEYLAKFLDYDYEFLDVGRARLSADPTIADPAFSEIADKMIAADAIVWVFGAWIWFVPLDLQHLLDKLFTLRGCDLTDKLAAAVMTSVRVRDDYILERARFFSEQLGMRWIGDVSAEGNPMTGYDDEEITESSCRALAGQLNRALSDGNLPARRAQAVDRRYLSSSWRGEEIAMEFGEAAKDGSRKILVMTGVPLAGSPAAASVIEGIRRASRNQVDVLEVGSQKVGRCIGCYLCDFKVEGVCVVKDDYETVKARMHEYDGVVFVGVCSCGVVDSKLKAFLDRSWGIAHRPSMGGRYGFAVAVGGGPLEADAATYLHEVLTMTGTRSLAALNPSGDPERFAETLRVTVEDLDIAMEEGWRIGDRFVQKSITADFRDLAAVAGMVLKADYKYRKDNRLFNAPSPGGMNAVLRLAFRSEGLQKRLVDANVSRIKQLRAKRFESFVSGGGRVGSGRGGG